MLPRRMTSGNAGLLVVDVQERLFPHMHDGEAARDRMRILIEAARELEVPIITTEQYVKGLGRTVPELQAALGDAYHPLEKTSFSCLGDAGIRRAMEASGRTHWVVAGMEAHVCVLQTVLDLLEDDCRVYVAEDAVASRNPRDRDVAVARYRTEGAYPTTTESVLFEWLDTATNPSFKRVQQLIK